MKSLVLVGIAVGALVIGSAKRPPVEPSGSTLGTPCCNGGFCLASAEKCRDRCDQLHPNLFSVESQSCRRICNDRVAPCLTCCQNASRQECGGVYCWGN